MNSLHRIYYSALVLLLAPLLHAQTPDAFNPSASGQVNTIAVQADCKTLVGGSFIAIGGQYRNRLARLNSDGTLDSGFDPNPNSGIDSITVQTDGKILVGGGFSNIAGQTRNCIARLNSEGTLDTPFNPNANNTIYSIALQADGKILVGGHFTSIGGQVRNRIARLNPDGTLDNGFNPNANNAVYSITVQTDGKILVGGGFTTIGGQTRNYIARLNSDGTLDSDLNPNANGAVYSIAVQSDGKALVGGEFTSISGLARSYLVRLNENGTLDVGFTANPPSAPRSLLLQADGGIGACGYYNWFNGRYGGSVSYVMKMTSSGGIDPSFSSDPYIPQVISSSGNTRCQGATLQSDGKILLGGQFDSVGGIYRNGIARITNSQGTSILTATGTSQINWTRGGSVPEVVQVTFESWNGAAWVNLGSPARISGGWRLTGLSLPLSGQIRARGRSSGGYFNGSSGIIEQTLTYGPPDIGLEAPTGTNVTTGTGTLAFGVNPPGQTQDITCTLRNTGGTELTGITPSILGTGASSFSLPTPPPATLAAGGSATFTVRFSATSGAKTATLSIASDDPDENPFTLTLTGTGNTAPTFSGYSASTSYQTAASISKSKLLTAASDADGDLLTVTAAGPTSAQGGTVALQSSSILYTPPNGFSGTDTFSVTIADPTGASVSGTVTVTVGPDPNSGGQGTNSPVLTMLPGGDVGIAFQGIPGRSYQVQRSPDLSSWTTITTVTAASNGAVTYTDTSPPPGSAFYRLRKP